MSGYALRNRAVEQPEVVLAVDVLLDGAAGAAEAHGVLRVVVLGDEARLHHQRRLAAEDEVVVGIGLVPVDHAIA